METKNTGLIGKLFGRFMPEKPAVLPPTFDKETRAKLEELGYVVTTLDDQFDMSDLIIGNKGSRLIFNNVGGGKFGGDKPLKGEVAFPRDLTSVENLTDFDTPLSINDWQVLVAEQLKARGINAQVQTPDVATAVAIIMSREMGISGSRLEMGEDNAYIKTSTSHTIPDGPLAGIKSISVNLVNDGKDIALWALSSKPSITYLPVITP